MASAKDRLNASLSEVSKIEQLLDQFEDTGDRGCLVNVATMMRELHPSLRELSVWSQCKTAECAPLLVTLSQRMKAAVARTRLLSRGATTAAQRSKADATGDPTQHNSAPGVSAAVNTVAPQPLSGWLKKQGEKGFVKGFKERYFVQRDSHLLYFVSDADVNKEPQGWIDLSRIISVHRSALPGGFDVSTSSRTFHLQVCIKSATPDKKRGSTRKLSGVGGAEMSEEAELLRYWVDGMLKWKEWQQQQIEEMNRAPASPQPRPLMEQVDAEAEPEPEPGMPVPQGALSPPSSMIFSDDEDSGGTPDGRLADPLCSSFVQSPVAKVPSSKRGKARRSLVYKVDQSTDEEAPAPVSDAGSLKKIAALDKKLASALKGEEAALEKLKGAQASSKELKAELRGREEEVQTLKRDLSAREKAAEELRDQVTALEETSRASKAQLNVLQNDIETLRKESVSKDSLLLQLGKKQRRRGRQWEGPEDNEKVEAREKEEREAQGERVVWLSSELSKAEKQLKIMTDAKEKTIAVLKDALDDANEKLRTVRLSKLNVKPEDNDLLEELALLKREYFGAIGVACKLSMQQSGIKVSSALDMDTLYDTVVETVDRQLWGRAISCALEGKKLPQ